MLLQIIAILVFFVLLLSYNRQKKIFKVYLKTYDGRTVTLNVATSRTKFENTTIKELREKIRVLLPGRQYGPDLRIIFAGKHLEDDRTLGVYNVTEESTLYSDLRLRGGGSLPPKDKDDVLARSESMERLYCSM